VTSTTKISINKSKKQAEMSKELQGQPLLLKLVYGKFCNGFDMIKQRK
jgi:hypothetical protein